jgi:hypothetical protein
MTDLYELPYSDTVGFIVYEAAFEIFNDAGCPQDFCVQYVSSNSVIFGSTNRVIWTPAKGFIPDRSYCTQKFLNYWDNRG